MPLRAGPRAQFPLLAFLLLLVAIPVRAGNELIFSNGFEGGLCGFWSSVVNPEVCDSVDNDCDTAIDEEGVCMVCGDGFLAPGEGCDDFNLNDGDGCSGTCQEEAGFDCTGEPSTCMAICGDGLIVGAEGCDDFNPNDGDGCGASCQQEPGFYCSGQPSTCITQCGDGIPAGIEGCDDPPPAEDGDGCSLSCQEEPGWSCTGVPSVCIPD